MKFPQVWRAPHFWRGSAIKVHRSPRQLFDVHSLQHNLGKEFQHLFVRHEWIRQLRVHNLALLRRKETGFRRELHITRKSTRAEGLASSSKGFITIFRRYGLACLEFHRTALPLPPFCPGG
jgi:hypothetical protein